MPIAQWLREHVFLFEGSTRSVALLRVLAVCVAWSRLGATLVPDGEMGAMAWATSMVFWASTSLMFVGLFSQPASLAVGLTTWVVYANHGDFGTADLHAHHVLAQALLCCLLSLTPCGRSFSVDRWLQGSRALPERGELWGLRLLQMQLVVLYAGAVWEKSYAGWLSGDRMLQVLMNIYLGSDPTGWLTQVVAVSIAWGTVFAEGGLALAVLFAPSFRSRLGAYLFGCTFHGLVYFLTPVSTFTATMAVWLLVLLPTDDVHRITERLLRPTKGQAPSTKSRQLPFLLGAAVLLLLPIYGRLVPTVPDGSGFMTLGEDVCEVRWPDGPAVAGTRRDVHKKVCGRPDLPSNPAIRCVVEGSWTDTKLTKLCRRLPKTAKRRESAR